MILIIDGYNVLKTIEKTDYVSPEQFNRFINELVRYARKSGNRVRVVFDGGPDLYPTKEKKSGITIIHSGQREHADDVIKRYLDESQGRDILLVSTDRELDWYAQRLGIEYIDSDDFYHRMHERISGLRDIEQQKIGGDDTAHKMSKRKDAYIDALMEAASESIEIKDADRRIPGPSRHKENQLTKEERRRLSKYKKI